MSHSSTNLPPVLYTRIIRHCHSIHPYPIVHLKKLFPPGIEPGTFCVLDRCDNHYTTETAFKLRTISFYLSKIKNLVFSRDVSAQWQLLHEGIWSPVRRPVFATRKTFKKVGHFFKNTKNLQNNPRYHKKRYHIIHYFCYLRIVSEVNYLS